MPLETRRWVVGLIVLLEAILLLAQLAIALFAPVLIIDNSPILSMMASYLEPHVPVLVGYKALSSLPQVAVAFYSLSIFLLPLQILGCAVFNFIAGQLPGASRLPLKMALLMVIALIILAFSLFFLAEDYSLIGHFGPNSSRLGLALFGGGQLLFLWLLAGTLIGEALTILYKRLPCNR